MAFFWDVIPQQFRERSNIVDNNKTEFVKEIFRGRDDCYGAENSCVKQSITDDVIWDHLTGKHRIGIYPLMQDKIWFAVADIDEDDMDKAKSLQGKFEEYCVKTYIERSKSKGYHLWMWFTEPVEASKARSLVKAVLTKMGSGFENIEIFPKQDKLDENCQYGNYINLPLFGIEDVNDGKTMFLNPDGDYQPYPDQWGFLGTIERTTPQKLDEVLEALQPDEDNETKNATDDNCFNNKNGLDNVLHCEFIEYCKIYAKTLSEPLWYAMVSNLCRFDGGVEIIHEYSKPYPDYTESETDRKIEHAKNDSSPHTCGWIQKNGFDCPRYGQCHVKSPAGLAYITSLESAPIHLSQIEDGKYEGTRVTTELMVAGIGCTYGVPKLLNIPLLESGNSKNVECTIKRDQRVILDCHKQSDAQLNAMLRKTLEIPEGTKLEIKERYTLHEILVVPKAMNNGNHEYKDYIVYYVADSSFGGCDDTILRSNVYYKATGVAMSEPKRQAKTMLITDLEQIDSPWQGFKLTPEMEGQFRNFKPDVNTVESVKEKLSQITRDITRNMTKRYGSHRERMLLVHLLNLSSPISCCFDGEKKSGWLEVMVIGDTAQAKTTLLQNLLKAINLGQLVCGSSASRTGLIYSLDNKVNDKRILVWGAFAHNNGGFIAVDEAHKLSHDEWAELTEVRSKGEIDVNRAIKGRHPAEVRQVYLANPPADRPMSHFYCGIESIKGMMRAEDIRRFDLVMIVAKGDNEDEAFLELNSEREEIPQVFTPELLRNHVCWAWQLSGENVTWTPEAMSEVKNVSKYLYDKYSGSVDIPLVVNDIRDKVCKWAQALAALLHSTTDDPRQLIVLPEHVKIIQDEIFDAVYNHDNCRLDEYAHNSRKDTTLTDEDYAVILNDIINLKKAELDGSTTDTLLEAFRDSHVITLSELIEITGLQKSAVSKRTSMLKQHGLIKSSKSGYYKTPKFIAFLRRLDDDNKTIENTQQSDHTENLLTPSPYHENNVVIQPQS
jgi:predicted transcriptional regulator